MKLHSVLAFLGAAIQQTLSQVITDVFPNTVNTGNSIVQFRSTASGLDGPKVGHSPNATSYDWWYFDAVSTNGNSSLVIVFYVATSNGFPFLAPGSALSVNFFATFENGSSVVYFLENLPSNSGAATVVTAGDGSSGNWNSTGAQWTSTPDMSSYVITVDAPSFGIKGSLILESVAPAHYPCSPVKSCVNLEVSPGIGWANAVPDADAMVAFTIDSDSLEFSGLGYHDKNWGVQPFAKSVDSWYWGHGRLGPYSIVWFDIIGTDGKEHVSSYATLNGEVVSSSCSGIKVRPTGANSEYPPLTTSGNPEGYHIELDLTNGQVLEVNVTTTLVTTDDPGLYSRFTGAISGGVQGSTVYHGVALYEQFTFST